MVAIEVAYNPQNDVVVEQARTRAILLHQQLLRGEAPSDTVQEIGQVGDLASFSLPLDFNALPCRERCTNKGDNDYSTHLPFGMAGPNTFVYSLPKGLEQFMPTVSKIVEHEISYYPWAQYEKITLSVDQTPVRAGTSQRPDLVVKHAHRDGYNDVWQHLYLVADNNPTIFYEADEPLPGWDIPLVKAEAFRRRSFHIGNIVFANVTTFHVSPEFKVDAARTFLRVTFDYDTSCLVDAEST